MAKRGRPHHPDLLTPRQQEVLALIRQGLTNQQIADRLGVTLEGAKHHVSEILSKLNVSSREQAAAWQPESLPRWRRILAPLPVTRALLLGGALVTIAALAVLAWAVLSTFDSDSEDTVADLTPTTGLTTTGSPVPTSTPTRTQPATAPAATYPLQLDGPAYVAVRGQLSPRSGGTLVMALADGSNEWTLVSNPVVVQVAGITGSAEPPGAVHYVRLDSQRDRTLMRLDLATGDNTPVTSWSAWAEWQTDAALSPDGSEVAYTDTSGLQLLDITSGTLVQLLASGSYDSCNGSPSIISECHNYSEPHWSPDGRWLFVGEAFYEGGHQLRLDRLDGWTSSVLSGGDAAHTPSRGVASPFSDAICAHGQYINASPLYIARPPDWTLLKYLPELDTGASGPSVIDCDWLDDSTVAVLVWTSLGHAELRVIDLETGDDRTVTTFGANLDSWQLQPGPRPESVTVDYTWDDQYGDPTGLPYGPEIVDLETGDRTPILAPGDRVFAVLTP